MIYKKTLFFIVALYSSIITAKTSDISLHLDVSELSRQYPSRAITVKHDPVYQQEKTYQAIALKPVLKKLASQYSGELDKAVVVFSAKDGYTVSMNYPEAIRHQGFLAYKDLSIKDTDWQTFKFGHEEMTPAPFYLIWTDPEADKWHYPWPFQLTTISLQPVEQFFAPIAPRQKDELLQQGFTLFSQYCIRCHAMNGTGGKVGPDLNSPQNISELYPKNTLIQLIARNRSLRPESKMPDFHNILSTRQISYIIDYLKSMKNK